MPEWDADLRARLAGLQLTPAREAEIIEELSQHLDDRYEENCERLRYAARAMRKQPAFTAIVVTSRSGPSNENVFTSVGQRAEMGRDFTEADDRSGAPPVVLVSAALWRALRLDPTIALQAE